MPQLDQIFQLVLDHYQAADPSQLPEPIKSNWSKAKLFVDDKITSLGIDSNAVASALGPSVAGMIGGILKNDSAAAGEAVIAGMVGVAALVGGPIGMVMGAGVAAIESAIFAVAGQAQGGKGVCDACPPQMYGGFDLAVEKPPTGATDPRWIKWTNQTPRKMDNDKKIVCSDDCPIGSSSVPSDYIWCGVSSGLRVSGLYGWLPWLIKAYPQDSYDGTLAQLTAMLLEKYINAQGPMPSIVNNGGPLINLRDVAERLLDGWNAIHDSAGAGDVMIDPTDPRIMKAVTSTFGGKTTTQVVSSLDAVISNRAPGLYAAYLINRDGRQPQQALKLHMGKLNGDLSKLYQDLGLGPKVIKLKPLSMSKAALQAKKHLSHKWGATAAGAAVGAVLLWPVGAVAGAVIGAAVDWWRSRKV